MVRHFWQWNFSSVFLSPRWRWWFSRRNLPPALGCCCCDKYTHSQPTVSLLEKYFLRIFFSGCWLLCRSCETILMNFSATLDVCVIEMWKSEKRTTRMTNNRVKKLFVYFIVLLAIPHPKENRHGFGPVRNKEENNQTNRKIMLACTVVSIRWIIIFNGKKSVADALAMTKAALTRPGGFGWGWRSCKIFNLKST